MTNGYLDSVLRLFALAEKIADRGGFTARSFAGIVAEQDIAQDSWPIPQDSPTTCWWAPRPHWPMCVCLW